MRLFVTTLAALTVWVGGNTLPALSQARVDSLKLTCDQANALVRQRGKVVLGTGPRRFELVVRGKRFCPVGEIARTYRTQTADKRTCQVGKICRGFARSSD